MTSVTKLGDFWKFFTTNLLSEIAQILDDILGYFENPQISSKSAAATFIEVGLLFSLKFGRTDDDAADDCSGFEVILQRVWRRGYKKETEKPSELFYLFPETKQSAEKESRGNSWLRLSLDTLDIQ